MTAQKEIRTRAIALLSQLPGESLVKAVEFLESLFHETLQVSQTTTPEASEAALIQIIQRGLSPEQH
jgi:hypothetical protein